MSQQKTIYDMTEMQMRDLYRAVDTAPRAVSDAIIATVSIPSCLLFVVRAFGRRVMTDGYILRSFLGTLFLIDRQTGAEK